MPSVFVRVNRLWGYTRIGGCRYNDFLPNRAGLHRVLELLPTVLVVAKSGHSVADAAIVIGMLLRVLFPQSDIVVIDEVCCPLIAGEIMVLRGVHDGNHIVAKPAHVNLHVERFILLILRGVYDFFFQLFPGTPKIGQQFRAERVVAEVAVGDAEQRALFRVARAGVELRKQGVRAFEQAGCRA